MSVENPAAVKKTRRSRRQSLPALAAKFGLSPTAIEQSPDGTVRLIFGNSESEAAAQPNGDTPSNPWDSAA